MSKDKPSYNKKYYEVIKKINNPMPYSYVTKKAFPEILYNNDTLQTLLCALKNRKDADDIFVSALLKSPRFWKYLISACTILYTIISYSFAHYFVSMNHVIEKTVNSKIPGLVPTPCQQK